MSPALLVQPDAASETTPSTCHDRIAELRWIVRIDGRAAALHVLRAFGDRGWSLLIEASLPPWTSARMLAPTLRWSSEVLPRVLRPEPGLEGLEIESTAPAIQLSELGHDAEGPRLEHNVFVLAGFVEHVRPILPSAPSFRLELARS